VTRAFAAIVLVSLWLGAALLTVTVVAPGAFAVLPTRALAGDMVGRVLPVLFAGAVVVPVLALAMVPRTSRTALAMVAGGVAVVAACLALFVVDPRLAALRALVGFIDQLPPADPRRTLFGLLHAASVALLGVALLAHAALLVALIRATVRRDPSTREAR